MLGKTYEGENCSAARALEVVGERWSLLIIRDALFRGITRFRDFQRSLSVASNVLASRLDGFVSTGIMRTRPSSDGSEYREYVLTEKGTALQPVIVALIAWGDSWVAPSGAPVVFEHLCGGNIEQKFSCTGCGSDVRKPSDVVARPAVDAKKTRVGSRKRTNRLRAPGR